MDIVLNVFYTYFFKKLILFNLKKMMERKITTAFYCKFR